MRSRYAHSTSSTAFWGNCARVVWCWGVSIITSCAPIPFILSNSPSPSRSSSPSIPSAGKRFGTTRMLQPEELALPPLRPSARISGGVFPSLPGQNGQFRGGPGKTLSRRKSIGRFPRSVEMITQRPVIGSLRNSGNSPSEAGVPYLEEAPSTKSILYPDLALRDVRTITLRRFRVNLALSAASNSPTRSGSRLGAEGCLVQPHGGRLAGNVVNRHHVKPQRALFQVAFAQEVVGGAHQDGVLFLRDAQFWHSGL